jgi:hypothetical protein
MRGLICLENNVESMKLCEMPTDIRIDHTFRLDAAACVTTRERLF